jgi:hypothetical protein
MNTRGMVSIAGDTSRSASLYAFVAGMTGINFIPASGVQAGSAEGMFWGYQSVNNGLQCNTLPFDYYPGVYTNYSTSPQVCMIDVTNL